MSDTRSASRRPLFIDMTSAWQERGRIAHGTTRVERGIVAGLAGMGVPDLQFCRYDRGQSRFIPVAREAALEAATAKEVPERRRGPVPSWRRHALTEAGKRAEAWVRHNIRDPFRARRARSAPAADETPFVPGSTLLIPGELQRQDFTLLARLKRQLPLRLAFVFYDLLDVLPADDPRLRNPAAHDLPSSDFITREADQVLAISEHSRRILLGHFAARGVEGPPVAVFRLGHDVRAAAADAAAVPGLRAGEFVLTVGDVVPRKNHALLVDVWRRLLRQCPAAVKPLIIVGRVHAAGTLLTEAIARDPVLGTNVRVLSNIDDRQLNWLYANCQFTVFPSLAEGYGLPVAESLAAGKVCVASSSTSLPEASQGCAIHLDPGDLEAWVAAVERLLVDPVELRRQMQRLSQFRPQRWSDAAADILRVLA